MWIIFKYEERGQERYRDIKTERNEVQIHLGQAFQVKIYTNKRNFFLKKVYFLNQTYKKNTIMQHLHDETTLSYTTFAPCANRKKLFSISGYKMK